MPEAGGRPNNPVPEMQVDFKSSTTANVAFRPETYNIGGERIIASRVQHFDGTCTMKTESAHLDWKITVFRPFDSVLIRNA